MPWDTASGNNGNMENFIGESKIGGVGGIGAKSEAKSGAGRRGRATAAVLAATALTLTACGGSGRDAEQAAPPSPPPSAHTETVTVERGAPSPTRAETTLKKATETATVTPDSDGYVARIPRIS